MGAAAFRHVRCLVPATTRIEVKWVVDQDGSWLESTNWSSLSQLTRSRGRRRDRRRREHGPHDRLSSRVGFRIGFSIQSIQSQESAVHDIGLSIVANPDRRPSPASIRRLQMGCLRSRSPSKESVHRICRDWRPPYVDVRGFVRVRRAACLRLPNLTTYSGVGRRRGPRYFEARGCRNAVLTLLGLYVRSTPLSGREMDLNAHAMAASSICRTTEARVAGQR